MSSRAAKRRPTPFRSLGGFVYRRRKLVVVAWVIVLVLVLPAVAKEGSVTSLQLGTTTGSGLESVQASNIISAQFAKNVPNSTLLVVVTGSNVSSVQTQAFISGLASSIAKDPGVKGLTQTVDVYSKLYATIHGLNNATYSTLDGANATSKLLLGVPALYLGAWEQAYSSTGNVTSAESAAYSYASSTLSAENSTAYGLYSSHVLDLFNSSWSESWSNAAFANLTVLERGTLAARAAGNQYLSRFSPGSASFGDALLKAVTLGDFMSDSHSQAAARIDSFAVGYVSNETAFSSTFVGSTFSLGRDYGNASRDALAGSIVWDPGKFGVGPQIATLVSSLVSPGRTTTMISLGLNQSSNSNVVAVRGDAASALTKGGAAAGVSSVQVTGQDAISYDFGNSTEADLGIILPVTIILLIVATGLFFRALLTPFVTLGTIGVALGISQIFIVLAGIFVAKVDFTIPTILLTVLIGVGTDYSVFVTARYREERVNGATTQQAVETAVTWAGESIATSGATVIISFLALAFTSVVFLRTIGFVVGLGVLVALAVALTMVPAILGLLAGRTFWPTAGDRFHRYSHGVRSKLERKSGYFSRSGRFSVKHAKVLIVVAVLVTVPAVYVYTSTTPTFDFLSAAPTNLQSISASNQLSAAFGGGRIFPTYVVMTFASPLVVGTSFNSTEMAAVKAATSMLVSSQDMKNVTSPTMPYGVEVDYTGINYSTQAGKTAFNSVMKDMGKDNRTVLFTLTYGIDPYSTQAISDTLSIRQSLHSAYGPSQGVTGVYVGGASGSILDTKTVFDSQFNSIVPIVAVGVSLVLLVVLGSLFLPVFAVLSVLMSIVWTLAATELIFRQLYNYQLLFLTPFFLFVTLLGLGMDYNVFILTRVREEATKRADLDEAIIGAIEQTGGIITAAAVILAGSLGALMLSSDLLLKQMGFAFAYSILIDALVVRTYLVPAVMSVMGRWNWYSPIPFFNRSKALFNREKATDSS